MLAAGLLLFGTAVSAAQDSPQAAPPRAEVLSDGSRDTLLQPRGSRLKFRNGPTCMCADGLSERDIRNAETPAVPQASPHTQSTDQ